MFAVTHHGDRKAEHVDGHDVESPLPGQRVDDDSCQDVASDDAQGCAKNEEGHVVAHIFFVSYSVDPYR